MTDFGPDNITLAEIETLMSAPFAPPPPDQTATRALFAIWIERLINPDALANCFLIGGAPDAVQSLHEECLDIRCKHSLRELVTLAKVEMPQ